MDVRDGIAEGGIPLNYGVGDFNGLIGRVVEHLNVELVFRIIQAADRVDETINNELFVKYGKLDCDAG